MNPTGRKHWHLEFRVDRRSTPRLWSNRRHKVYICLNMALGLSGEPLDSPNNRLLLWLVLGTPKGVFNLCLGSVLRYRNLDDYMGSK